MRFLFLLILLFPATVFSRPLIADLAVRQINIDHNFAGIEMLLFGARGDFGDIVVVLRGPEGRYIVRKKDRVAGLWVNRESAEFDHVPALYAVASTRPLSELENPELLKTLGIGIDNLHFPVSKGDNHPGEFQDALLRQQQRLRLYTAPIGKVSFWGETLFRTVLTFPKNTLKGTYTAEIYLFSGGQLAAMQSTPVTVRKIGFESFIYDAAHKRPLLYGLLAVSLALLAGWLASLIFQRL